MYITPAMYRTAKIPQAATKGHPVCVCVFFNTSEKKKKKKRISSSVIMWDKDQVGICPKYKRSRKKNQLLTYVLSSGRGNECLISEKHPLVGGGTPSRGKEFSGAR